MNHKELKEEAIKQLKRWHCYPICGEISTYISEIPDAIGWSGNGSILFECKASRKDFLKDKKKTFRIVPESGVGDFRFYITNPGIIKDEKELPEGWGCYEVENRKIKHKFGIKYENAVPIPLKGNKDKEIIIIRSWIRRFIKKK